MKKIIRLTESDLARIVKRVIREQKESIDIGDMYKVTWKDGSHIRFKITKKEDDESYYGTVLGVYGKFDPEDDMKQFGYRSAKVGDSVELVVQGASFPSLGYFLGDDADVSVYLPKTYGEMEAGSGDMITLEKLN